MTEPSIMRVHFPPDPPLSMSSGTCSFPSLMVCHMAIDVEETNRVCVGDEKAERSIVMKLNPTTKIQIPAAAPLLQRLNRVYEIWFGKRASEHGN